MAIIMAAIAFACGCSPRYADAPLHHDESLCEESLQQLQTLIESKSDDPSFPSETLTEAKELRSVAAELYLNGAIDLALELIDEAFALFRNET
jgi:hypothetical protein